MKELKNQKGFSIIMAVAVLALGAILLLGAMRLAGGQGRLISAFIQSEDALQYAEKGYNKYLWELNKDAQFYLDDARYELDDSTSDSSKNIYKPLSIPSPDPSYRVEIEVPVEMIGSTPVLSSKKVIIRSTGWAPETPARKRTLQVELVRRTFAQYGMITNNDITDNGSPIYWTTGETFYGPLHTNQTLYISGSPVFYGPVTYGTGISPSSAMTDSSIFRRGVAGADKLDWPSTNSSLMARARIAGQGHYYTGRTCIMLRGDCYDVRSYAGSDTNGVIWNYNGTRYQVEDTGTASDKFVDRFKFYIPSIAGCGKSNPTFTGAFSDFKFYCGGSLPLPDNGVIYVNGDTNTDYGNYYDKYAPALGNVFVSGSLIGKLTIAGTNDIFITAWDPTDWRDPWRISSSSGSRPIDSSGIEESELEDDAGDVCGGVGYDSSSTYFRQEGSGSDWDHTRVGGSSQEDILGLVANNDIQILHWGWPAQEQSYSTTSGGRGGGGGGSNTAYWVSDYGWRDTSSTIYDAAPDDIIIQAALFSTQGVFGYEGYGSGGAKGTINLVGSIAEHYRGPVGTFNSYNGSLITGYEKEYCHDPRMLYTSPPYYIEPANVGWQVGEWKEISIPVE